MCAFGKPEEVISPEQFRRVYGVEAEVQRHPRGSSRSSLTSGACNVADKLRLNVAHKERPTVQINRDATNSGM